MKKISLESAKIISVLFLIFFVSSNLLAVTNYVSKSGGHISPFDSWPNAATNIQAAIDIASSCDTVIVNDGVYNSGGGITPGYSCSNRVVITNDITVKSQNGPKKTIILGSGPLSISATRGVYISAGILDGFTVSNGHTLIWWKGLYNDHIGGGVNMYNGNGMITNCIIIGNKASGNGGGTFHGTVNNCTISKNSTGVYGGGSCYGTLNNCKINQNSAGNGGGGVSYGTLNNCIINGNLAADYGGGASLSMLNNCTISGNSANNYGGGICRSTANNSIIYFNYASTSLNYYDSTIKYSCATALPYGTGNISHNPNFLDSGHIASDSPCIGVGSSNFITGLDIDNNVWNILPAMGCDQPDNSCYTGKLSVLLFAKYNKITTGYLNYFFGSIIGKASFNKLSFDNNDNRQNSLGGYYSWNSTGFYKVILTAYNDSYLAGISATTIIEVVEKQTYYVDKSNSNPIYPYTTLKTATTNIQNAIDVAYNHGDIVLVNNGNYDSGGNITPGYSCSNRVVITNDITLKSLNGPEKTTILGEGPLGNGAVRGVYMSAGILEGFTISNGHTRTDGAWLYDKGGGGVNMYGSCGLITNCIIIKNSAANDGGGIVFGTINNCIISKNVAADDGGGTAWCTVNNCIISDNSAANSGGGTYGETINNCIIRDNLAKYGGGTYDGTINSCTIYNNLADNNGGGTYGGTINNSVISGNMAANNGGGMTESTVNNCTIIRNSANGAGGGIYNNMVNNCIICDNLPNNFYISTIRYSCTTPLPNGIGNISTNPLFHSASNLRLQQTSPCINGGTNYYTQMPYDLLGNPRIVDEIVDMGAYEYIPEPVLFINCYLLFIIYFFKKKRN